MTLGPTIASGILSLGTWPWLFAVNIPFGLIAIAIGMRTLPRRRALCMPSIFSARCWRRVASVSVILGIGSAAHEARLGLVAAELSAAIVLGGC